MTVAAYIGFSLCFPSLFNYVLRRVLGGISLLECSIQLGCLLIPVINWINFTKFPGHALLLFFRTGESVVGPSGIRLVWRNTIPLRAPIKHGARIRGGILPLHGLVMRPNASRGAKTHVCFSMNLGHLLNNTYFWSATITDFTWLVYPLFSTNYM